MKVFISQSRERSREVAFELQKFVRVLVMGTDPWVSNTGIEKGTRWGSELAENLDAAGAGIICLDADNLDDRWILFEAGALSRKPKDKVWTFLLDVEYSQVQEPLSQFQHTRADRADILLMIESIGKTVSAHEKTQRHEGDVRELFDLLWPKLDARLAEIRAKPAAKPKPTRTTQEMVVEVLDVVRGMNTRLDSASWMTEKTLKMLHQVYRAAFGENAPSLAALRKIVASSEEATSLPMSDLLPTIYAFRDYYSGPQFQDESIRGKSIGELMAMKSVAAVGQEFPPPTAIRPKTDASLSFVSEPPAPLVAEAEAAVAAEKAQAEAAAMKETERKRKN